jgi:hypothetical protein
MVELMAYSNKEIEDIFNVICDRGSKGESLRKILESKDMPSSQTFYIWLDDDEEKSKRYARACADRADKLFEEILTISDDDEDDEKAFVGVNHIQRDKLRIDARKWVLSKMQPTKYGDKLQVDSTIDDKRKTIDELFPSDEELLS